MAFSLTDDKRTIDVVVSKDSAVTCSPGEYSSYLEDLDESKLKLNGSPTYFVLKKRLTYKDHQTLMRAQARFRGKDYEPDLSSILEDVRIRLCDIKNPADLPKEKHVNFVKENDGYASKELIAALQSYGVLFDLSVAAKNSDETKNTAETKKN